LNFTSQFIEILKSGGDEPAENHAIPRTTLSKYEQPKKTDETEIRDLIEQFVVLTHS